MFTSKLYFLITVAILQVLSPLTSSLVAANPTIAASNPLSRSGPPQTCECTSPSGCPGECGNYRGFAYCSNYCGTESVLPCGACKGMATTTNCIYDFSDGSCFTL